MKYLKRFNENLEHPATEDDEVILDIIRDYELNNNTFIDDKNDMVNYLNKFMDDINLDWSRLSELYDEYDVDTWEDLMIKLIDNKLNNLVD